MKSIKPRKAVFDRNYVKLLDGKHVKKGKNKRDLAEQLRADIRDFKKKSKADRLVMIWCASTETFTKQSAVHESLDAFERGLSRERRHPGNLIAHRIGHRGIHELARVQELLRDRRAALVPRLVVLVPVIAGIDAGNGHPDTLDREH